MASTRRYWAVVAAAATAAVVVVLLLAHAQVRSGGEGRVVGGRHRYGRAQGSTADMATVAGGAARGSSEGGAVGGYLGEAAEVTAARREAQALLSAAYDEETRVLQAVDGKCPCLQRQRDEATHAFRMNGGRLADGSPLPYEVACPGDCSGHGVCAHIMCLCDPGWSGTGCWTPFPFPSSPALSDMLTVLFVPDSGASSPACIARAVKSMYVATLDCHSCATLTHVTVTVLPTDIGCLS